MKSLTSNMRYESIVTFRSNLLNAKKNLVILYLSIFTNSYMCKITKCELCCTIGSLIFKKHDTNEIHSYIWMKSDFAHKIISILKHINNARISYVLNTSCKSEYKVKNSAQM